MEKKTTVITREQLDSQFAFCNEIKVFWQGQILSRFGVCWQSAAMPLRTPPRVPMWW